MLVLTGRYYWSGVASGDLIETRSGGSSQHKGVCSVDATGYIAETSVEWENKGKPVQ